MTVRQLLASTDSAELGEWMAFYRLERAAAEDDPIAAEAQLRRVFGRKRRG